MKKAAYRYSGKKGVVVRSFFGPKDVALAPVKVPAYLLDPGVLLPLGRDVQHEGDEFIILSKGDKLGIDFEIA